MLALPNECLFEIFTKLKNYNRCLFSCLLVNRQWCRNVVPILWSGPVPFENRKFIRTCLMALNSEEKAELIPFNIFLPINVKLLFKYTSYITTIKILSDDGIKKWLDLEGPPELAYHSDLNYIVRDAIETIRYSLVLMFLRTSNNIKDLKAYGMFYSKTTSLLIEIADKSTTVTNLSFWKNRLGPEGTKLLAEALCKNSTLTFLDLWGNCIGPEGGKALAKALYKNNSLTHLKLNNNQLGPDGGKALAKALCENKSLISLDLWCNKLGPDGGKAFAETLCKNTALLSLDLSKNLLGFEGIKALTKALCKNNTLTFLDLSENQLDTKGGMELAKALCMNTTLASLKLCSNQIDDIILSQINALLVRK